MLSYEVFEVGSLRPFEKKIKLMDYTTPNLLLWSFSICYLDLYRHINCFMKYWKNNLNTSLTHFTKKLANSNSNASPMHKTSFNKYI